MPSDPKYKGRAVFRAVFLFVVVFGGILGTALALHPDTPLPDHWNPTRPLQVRAPITPLTDWKLSRTAGDPQACIAALQDHAQVVSASPISSENPNCGNENAVTIAGVGQASLTLQTACASALRLAMWEQHSLQPAAQSNLETTVTAILDQGSYNCRPIRSSSGNSTRWSTHATADAIDVRGFRMANSDSVILLRDWDGAEAKAAFLRAVHAGSCRWFKTTLGPDYNALHADHFHLQSRGWGTCR